MIDTSAVNESLKNASEYAKHFPSKAEGIALCGAPMLSSVLIIAGNLPTLVIFAVTKPPRRKSLFLVMNMAFADLMLGAYSIPSYIYFVGGDYQLWTTRYSYDLVLKCIDAILAFGSYLSVVFISCERFYAVYWPFNHRSLSARIYHIAIFILWTLAVLLSSMLTLSLDFNLFEPVFYIYVLLMLGLAIIICVCNIGIWGKLQHESVTSQHQNRAQQRKRLTKTLFFVSMLALLCWLPLVIMNILIELTETTIPLRFYLMVNNLNYSNSFVNPVVYALRIPEFQQAFRSCCRKRIATIQTEQIEKRNRTAAPATPEIQLRIVPLNPAHLQEELEQEDMDTHF